MRKGSWLLILLMAAISLTGCQTEDRREVVEAYVAEVNDPNLEVGAYKNINVITYISGEAEMRNLETTAFVIEDIYEKDGTYVETRLTYSAFAQDTMDNPDDTVVTVDEKKTILLSNEATVGDSKELSKDQKERIKQQVLDVFNQNGLKTEGIKI